MRMKALTITMAVLGMVGAALPASVAIAQHAGQQHQDGGPQGGGDHQGGGPRGGGGHQGGGGNPQGGGHGGGYRGGRGGGYGGGYGRGDGGAGFAFGAVLGYYAGHPYYCRHHRHWRWSHRLHRYVYRTRGGYC